MLAALAVHLAAVVTPEAVEVAEAIRSCCRAQEVQAETYARQIMGALTVQ